MPLTMHDTLEMFRAALEQKYTVTETNVILRLLCKEVGGVQVYLPKVGLDDTMIEELKSKYKGGMQMPKLAIFYNVSEETIKAILFAKREGKKTIHTNQTSFL